MEQKRGRGDGRMETLNCCLPYLSSHPHISAKKSRPSQSGGIPRGEAEKKRSEVGGRGRGPGSEQSGAWGPKNPPSQFGGMMRGDGRGNGGIVCQRARKPPKPVGLPAILQRGAVIRDSCSSARHISAQSSRTILNGLQRVAVRRKSRGSSP